MFGRSRRRWFFRSTRDHAATRRTVHHVRLSWLEPLEHRQLLATLQPIADVTVPQYLGYQVPLAGGADLQTYQVTSSNPDITAAVAHGKFMTVTVSHTSSGANDPAFTGSLTFELFDDLTPLTTGKIEGLVTSGFYTGKKFHRVASGFPGPNDFIVQGGSVNGDGTGNVNQPGFPFQDEFNTQLAFTGSGQLAMANAGPNTNTSQFFVTTGSPRFLDFGYTLFGQLVSGADTLTKLTAVAANGTTPVSPVLMTSVALSDTSPDGVIHINAGTAAAGETSTITVTATDTVDSSTTSRTFHVTVAADLVNGQPNIPKPFLQPVPAVTVGLAQSTPTAQGQTVVIKPPGVDANPTDSLSYIIAGGVDSTRSNFLPVTNATASVDASGFITVTPNAGFTGTLNLLIGVRDQTDRTGTGNLDTVQNYDTRSLAITVANTPPVILPTATAGSVTVAGIAPTAVQLAGVPVNSNPADALTYTLVSQPADGTITGFNPQTGALTYTAKPGFSGTDMFTFRVTDPLTDLSSAAAAVTLHVSPASPPTATAGSAMVAVNTPTNLQLAGVPSYPGDSLIFGIVNPPSHGSIVGFNPQLGTLVYTSDSGFYDTDTLTFHVLDVTSGLISSPATFSIQVIPAFPPVAVAASATVVAGSSVTVQLRGDNGSQGVPPDPSRSGPLTFSLLSQPSQGSISGFNAQTGTLTYTANAGAAGLDSFTFRVTDSRSGLSSSAATFTLYLTPALPPSLDPIADVTVAAGAGVSVAAHATDPLAGGTIVYSLAVAPAGATIDAATGAFAYTPPATFGTTSIPVTIVATHHGNNLTLTAARSFMIHVVSRPLVTATGAVMTKRGSITAIVLHFSGPLDAATAGTLAHYQLNAARHGRHGTVSYTRNIPIRIAHYTATPDPIVTLTLKRPASGGQTYQLRATGLLDMFERPIAGPDLVAILGRGGIHVLARAGFSR